jgi:hypothetical protein
MIAGVGDIRRDPCAADGAVFDPADVDTPAKVAAAMATWPGFAVTDPVEITFAGAPGVQLDVSAGEDLGTCSSPTTWSTPMGTGIDGYPMAGEDPTSGARHVPHPGGRGGDAHHPDAGHHRPVTIRGVAGRRPGPRPPRR